MTGPPKVPPLPRIVGGRPKVLGFIGLLLIIEVFFYLLAIENSPLFGGAWSSFSTTFLFYIVSTVVAIVLVMVWDIVPSALPGDVWKFIRWYGALLLVAMAIMLTLGHYSGAEGAIVSGAERTAGIVWVMLFVAPVEEFLFRVVLSQKYGWVLGSVIGFSVFHLAAYSVNPSSAGGALWEQLIVAGILGGVLFLVYDWRDEKGNRRFGYGGAVGAHAGYDLAVLGFVGGLAIGPHLGLSVI